MPDITNIVNTILANGSTEYQSRVPVATRNNIVDVGNAILSYTPNMNEFLSALVNKIAFTLVRTKTWENPLSVLKKGTKPLGFDIENIHVNPATDGGYVASGSTLLNTTAPDVKVEYFRLNRQGQYTATIYRNQLRHAFTSWENLNSLIDGIVNSLYSGDYIDEFILMKNALADAVLNQKMITASMSAIADAATATAFITAVKQASSGMTYPGTAFNAYAKAGGAGNPVTTWTPKDQQILIVRSDILNYIDVNVLAAAFNMGKQEFMTRVVEVDNFGSMSKINAILLDEAALQVYDDMSEMTEFYNPKGLYTNFYWNHWQTYAVSLMANAIAFVDDAVAPNAPVITQPAAGATQIAGTGEAGATVFCSVAGETKFATVAVGGAWTCTGFTALVQGDNIVAYQVDDGGNKSTNDTEVVGA